jgi:hypothetical protein
MAKKKRVDPVKQREKRVKIAAIVGVVLFVLAAAYEIPSMLKVMNKKPPVGTTYDPGPSLTPGGLPNVAVGSAGSTSSTSLSAGSSGELVDTDVPPPSGSGQLVSFSVFQTKNPFAPQVSSAQAPPDTGGVTATTPTTANNGGADVPAGTTTTPDGTTTTSNGTTTTLTTLPGGGSVLSTQGPPTTTSTTTTVAQPAVAISVNGVVSHVASSDTFPTGAPVFRLVSWKKGSAQIAIVGGSYSAGGATLTLEIGKPVTLENQTNSKRYTIELLAT